MTFWLVAAVLLALALGLLVLPMLRAARAGDGDARRRQNIAIAREQKRQLDAQLEAGEIDAAAHAAAQADLETALALELEAGERGGELARGRWLAGVLVVALPLASVWLYLAHGEPGVIENPSLAAARAPAPAAPQMSLDEMQDAIRDRLRQNPDDAEGWFMFGRVSMAKREFDKAVAAFQRSHDLVGDEPGVMFALADALAMQNGGNLEGEPESLVRRGLEIAPRFPNGLWLAGMAAEQRGDDAAAHRYWSQLLPLIRDDPNSAREIRALLASLEERNPALAQGEAASAAATLRLSVDIAADLRAKAAAGDAVFVYAKAMQGPPMPLAVRRLRVGDLPVRLTLSDSDAMMPALKLSAFDRVIVGARVSPSGNPVAQAGDFYTERDGISSADPPAQIELVIDRVK